MGLLGWGEVTVRRYKSKTVQDETYDHLMLMTQEDLLFALESLGRHKIHEALPLAYKEIICLSSVKMQEEMCYPISSKTFEQKK